MIYLADTDFTLHVGDVRDVLAELPAESVHCVVTSPPYWGLRDYGTSTWDGGDPDCDHLRDGRGQRYFNGRGEEHDRGGAPSAHRSDAPFADVCGRCGARRVDRQLGLEPTPDEYVANMVDVFRQVRRVLRADGTLWLNLGDSYASGEIGRHDRSNGYDGEYARASTQGERRSQRLRSGLKPKDLVGIPWRVAFALQDDGWYLRSDIIWAKPNPMPESVTDRPTKAHEYLFLLTKSPRYYFDQEAVRETWADDRNGASGSTRSKFAHPGTFRQDGGVTQPPQVSGRNVRSVWEIATQPYPDAHFATFPEELPRRCILAGTSEHGVCPECGAPWERIVEKGEPELRAWSKKGAGNYEMKAGGWVDRSLETGSTLKHIVPTTTVAWWPSCRCGTEHDGTMFSHDPVPATVLDPFAGSGTTNHVARKHGRHSIGIELNPAYADLCARRMQQLSLLA